MNRRPKSSRRFLRNSSVNKFEFRKGVFESFVDLIDVATDWSLIVLVVLIVFRKEIGVHASHLVKEVIKLIARVQRITVGGTTYEFSALQDLAKVTKPELFHNIFLRTPVDAEPVEVDEAVAEEGESEAEEFAAALAKFKRQQV